MQAASRPTVAQVWQWLEQVPDPEIPVISLVDLGVIRDVRYDGDTLVVVVTPTYSGCPATAVIQQDIETALRSRGVADVRIERRLSPPWSTDWLSDRARANLKAYGIAPPVGSAGQRGGPIWLRSDATPVVPCPRCGSQHTARVSQFGSTPCKASYRCQDCLEPFDYFKCI